MAEYLSAVSNLSAFLWKYGEVRANRRKWWDTEQLADNIHARGTYKYPVKNNYLRSGMLFYRLNVNGLAVTKKVVKIN